MADALSKKSTRHDLSRRMVQIVEGTKKEESANWVRKEARLQDPCRETDILSDFVRRHKNPLHGDLRPSGKNSRDAWFPSNAMYSCGGVLGETGSCADFLTDREY